MPTNFTPMYTINHTITKYLMRIEGAKKQASMLPMNLTVLASLRETARLYTTHYSTMIEGNKLTSHEVEKVITLQGHFPGRERDENEVKGYYAALGQLEEYVTNHHGVDAVTENEIQLLHALVMNGGYTL